MLPLVAHVAEMCETACLRGPQRTRRSRVRAHTPTCGGRGGQPCSPLCGFLTYAALFGAALEPALNSVNTGSVSASARPARPPPRHVCRDSAHHAEAAARYLRHRHPSTGGQSDARQVTPARDKHVGGSKRATHWDTVLCPS